MNRRSGGTSTRSRILFAQGFVRRRQTILEQIGHDHQLHRPPLGLASVGDGAAAAPPAADQGQPDRVVFTGMHVGNRYAGQRRGGRQCSAALEKLPPRCLLPRSRGMGAMLCHGCPFAGWRLSEGMVCGASGIAALIRFFGP